MRARRIVEFWLGVIDQPKVYVCLGQSRRELQDSLIFMDRLVKPALLLMPAEQQESVPEPGSWIFELTTCAVPANESTHAIGITAGKTRNRRLRIRNMD